jgi:hypothetical protein
MAIFRNGPEEFQRLDWALLQNGAVTLYFRPQGLIDDVQWLKEHEYRITSFDCSTWTSVSEMHDALSFGLEFPDYYGRNFAALNDCIGDLEISDEGGRVIIFNRYDSFAARFPQVAWDVLDIMETNSRRFLLFGRRLIVLVQSDNPEISFETVGGQSVSWNIRELLSVSRRL